MIKVRFEKFSKVYYSSDTVLGLFHFKSDSDTVEEMYLEYLMK